MRAKTLTKIISLVVINALTALLIFQINFSGGKNSPTQAASETPNYTATWTPSLCRELTDSTRINPRQDQIKAYPEDLRVGVAEWQVEYSGDISGKEKWVVPDDPNNPNDGWVDLYAVNGNYKHQKFETEECNDTYSTRGGSHPIMMVMGMYGYTFKGVDSQGTYSVGDIGGSYPKSWKVCKVNAFTDPC